MSTLTAPEILTNLEVALLLCKAGVRVFPCQSRGARAKSPCEGMKWQDAPLGDEEWVIGAWEAFPDAIPGMELVAQNILVIDTDGEEGQRQWAQIIAKHGGDAGWPRTITPNGVHHFFLVPEGKKFGNGLGSLRPKKQGGKIDVRGPGAGYVIAPGAEMYEGDTYFANDGYIPAFLDAPEMPGWLIQILEAKAAQPARLAPTPSTRPSATTTSDARTAAWAEAAFDQEIANVANCGEGGRNDTLNVAAFSLFRIVAGGHLAGGRVLDALRRACITNGLTADNPKEVEDTIRSARSAGMRKPRAAPEGGDEADMEAVGRAAAAKFSMAKDGTVFNDETGEIFEASHVNTKGRAPLPFFTLDEIEPVLDQRDFVQGLLVEGSAAVVYGASNCGKTFFVTDLALHVAAGLEWNERRVEQGGVLYFAMEGGAAFKNRAAAWKTANPSDDRLPFAVVPASLNIRDQNDADALIQKVRDAENTFGCPIKLIVIDTLSRAMAGGDENSSVDMGAFVKSIDAIRAATAAAVLLIHHSGKNAAMGARGHSLLLAAIDTEIEVTLDEATGFCTAAAKKQRDLPKDVAVSFRLKIVALGEDRYGEPETTCLVVPGDRNHLYVNDRSKKTNEKRLPVDQSSLLREIETLIIDEGIVGRPQPGMPEVRHGSRKSLHSRLVRNDWIHLPEDSETLPQKLPQRGVKISTPEYRRLNKNLNYLRDKGKIGFDRAFVWPI